MKKILIILFALFVFVWQTWEYFVFGDDVRKNIFTEWILK